MAACSESVPSGCSISKFPSILGTSELFVCCTPEVPRPAVNTKWEAPCGILPPDGIEATASCRSLGVKACRESNHVCHVLPSISCSSTKRLEIVKARVVERPFSFAQNAVIRLNFSRLRESRNITPFSSNFWACWEKDNRSKEITSCGAEARMNNMPRCVSAYQSVD